MILQVNSDAFSLKSQSGLLELMVNMNVLASSFAPLAGSNSEQRRLSSSENKHRQLNPLHSTEGIYNDPDLTDNVSPFWPGTTPEEAIVEEQQSIDNEHQAREEAEAMNSAMQCYTEWIIKHKVHLKKRQNGVWTQKEYDTFDRYYYDLLKMPVKCQKLLLEEQRMSLVTIPKQQAKEATEQKKKGKQTGKASGASISSSIPIEGLEGQVADTENYAANSFIKDYAIIINTSNEGRQRIDLNIIPRIYITPDTPQEINEQAFFCRPNNPDLLHVADYLSSRLVVVSV